MHYTECGRRVSSPRESAPDLARGDSVGVSTIGGLWRLAQALFSCLRLAIAFSSLDRFIDLQRFDLNTSRERELYFHTIAEAVPEIIWTATPDGQERLLQPKMLRLYRVKRLMSCAERDGKTIVHPDDLDGCTSQWQNALRVGEPYEIEYRLRGKDGKLSLVPGPRQSIRNPTGEIVKWVRHLYRHRGIRSKTSRIWKVRSRSETCNWPRQIAGCSASCIFKPWREFRRSSGTANPDGAIDFTNRKWLDYSGLTAEQSLGEGLDTGGSC